MSKEGQDKEAIARLANDPSTGRMDREANAAALDVIDDLNMRNGDDNFQPRQQPKGEDDVTPRQPPQLRPDNKRNEIINRFRQTRDEKLAADAETLDNFTRSGIPPEFDQFREKEDAEEAPAERSGGQDDERQEPEQTRQKVKLKVNHKDVELDMDDVIKHAQMALAADDILGNAKKQARELDEIVSNARNRAARPGPDADHHTGADRSQHAEGEQDQDPGEHTSDLGKLVETLQYGEANDAAPLLQDTIERAADRIVTNKMQQNRMADEAARTAKVLTDFNNTNPGLLKDPYAQSVIKQHIYQAQVDDLTALGVTMEALAASVGHAPTPGDISNAHQFYRAEGYKLKKPEQMLNEAHDHMLEWRGTKTKDGQKDPPVSRENGQRRPAPRIAVNVDREDRRQAITPAPNRTASPQQRQQPTPQRQDKSSIVQRMQQQRNLARGRA